MFDKYDVPDFVDLSIKDAYRAILFQMIFWRRQSEKAAFIRVLRDVGLNKENDAYKGYTDYIDIIFSGTAENKLIGLTPDKVKEIMEEESKKAYVVTPVTGLKLRKRK